MMYSHFLGSRAATLTKIYFTKFLFGVGKLKHHTENMPKSPKPNLLYSCVQVWIFARKTLLHRKQIVTGHHATVTDMSSKGLLVLVKSYKKQNPILSNRTSDKMVTKTRTSQTFQVLPLSWWSLWMVDLSIL